MDVKIENRRTAAEKLFSAPVLTFISCFISGVLTHLFALTNKIPNWDDVTDVNWFGMGNELGRWLIPYVWRMSSSYSAPSLHGIQAIALISLAAAVCVVALKVRDWASGMLIGISFAVFPALVSGMTYMFTIHVYAVAILFSMLAAFLTIRVNKIGWIFGIVLIFMSLSIYQAFYVFASGVFVISLAGDLLGKDDSRDILKRGLKYLAVLLVSMFSYLAFIRIAGFQLISYRGADSMGQISLSSIPLVVARSYHRFLQYFFTGPDSYIGPWTLLYMREMFVLAFAIPLAAFIIVYKRKAEKDPLRVALFLICMGLLPLALGGVYIMAPGVQKASTIMIYPYVLIFAVPAAVLRDRIPRLSLPNAWIQKWKTSDIKDRLISVLCLVFTVTVILCAYQYSVIAGSAYFRSYIAKERVGALYNRILVRLEEQEGFQYGDKILICGDWWPEKNILSSYDLNFDQFKDLDGVTGEHGLYTSGVRRQFIRTYLGVDYDMVVDEEGLAVEATSEYKNMPVWPDQGCVRKFGDLWIVKMHD